ncbi:MAG: glutamate--cysteine ligase [Rhodospirillales bacterium]|nr:glutamate--cysteine ligase [Rhodospirillales bacterium]
MSGASAKNDTPIDSKDVLVRYMEAGCKPPEQWRIGTEHEKFAFRLSDLKPLTYDGDQGIRELLMRLTRFGWEPVYEGENVIALSSKDGGSVSLEPAGQLELSGAAVENIHQTCDEVSSHLQQVKAIAKEMGIGFVGLGYRPKWPVEDVPWMPKGRYKIMREYMPKKGNLGLEMMQSTCTVQVNLDFCSEEVMVEMFRISLALQPVATALWANSPFRKGKPSEYLSYRSHIWTDVDPDRSGMLPFVFEDGMGFERYVDYALDVPMYFVYRDGKYIDASGQSFRDFMKGELPAYPGHKPVLSDWADHISTIFPEVRLKTFLEMRGADGGPWNRLCALSAFWVGLLYDSEARAAAYDLIKDWTDEERQALRDQVPTTALKTPFRNQTVREIACEALCISHRGLKNRARLDSVGMDESHFLQPIFQTAESGLTPADELLAAYHRLWKGNVDQVFTEYAY